jgi:hypothetical protein
MSPAGLGPENDFAGEGQQQNLKDRPVVLSERAPHINKPATDSNKNLVLGPQMGAWHQDRLADWPSLL